MVTMVFDQSQSKGLIRIAIIRTIYEYFDILLVIIMIITRLQDSLRSFARPVIIILVRKHIQTYTPIKLQDMLDLKRVTCWWRRLLMRDDNDNILR